jgi:hypothetical protein
MHPKAHQAHGPAHSSGRYRRWLRAFASSWLAEALPALVLAAALLIPYLGYPLVWDNGWYYECLTNATHTAFEFKKLLCFQHPTFLFLGIFMVPEYLMPGSVWAVHAIMFAWFLLSVAAFGAICRKLLPNTRPWTRMLATALYATQPVLLANATGFNVDAGVTFTFVMVLALLLYEKHWQAILLGILMTFTKETGVLFYALAVGGHWVLTLRPQHVSTVHALRASWRRVFHLVPPLLFVLYSMSNVAFFEGHDSEDLARIMTSFDLLHPRFHLMLKEIFLFQFTWFQTAVILAGAALWAWHWDHGNHRRMTPHARMVWLFAALYAIGTYFITRYDHFNNVRYFMIIFPLGTALFAVSVSYLLRREYWRGLLLGTALALQLIALFYSADPLSRRLFGTFSVGRLEMYPLGSFDACCAYGRDQLIYNFQHLKIVSMQDEILSHIRPQAGTVIGNHPLSWFGLNENADPVTYRRSLKPNAIKPLYLNANDLLALPNPPASFWYIAYPHMSDQAKQLSLLQSRYTMVEKTDVEKSGYVVPLYRFVPK